MDMYLTTNSNSNMTKDELIEEEIINLNQKVEYAETAQDMLFIFDRMAEAINNDADLGRQVRKFVMTHFSIEK